MTARQSFLAFLFAVCLAQGAFLGPVAASLKGANRRATQLLALLILCFLPMIGEEWLEVAGLTERWPHVIASSIAVDYLIAPLLLFYAWSITDTERRFTRSDLLHFLPFAVALLVLLPYYALSGQAKLAVLESGLPSSMKLVITGKIGLGAAYLTAVLRHMQSFVRRADNPRARDPHVIWFLRMMYALAGMALASLVLGLLPPAGVPVPIDSDTLGTLFLCSSIYMISFLLIRHPLTVAGAGVSLAQLVVPARSRPRYETSPLGEVQKQEYLDRLVRYMENEKPFLDMQLSLDKLAGALDLKPGYLSQVLNERLELNFYEFVNEYRVREAQAKIADAARADRTLLAIAHESGFNSKASFNRAFRRVTGKTPSEYARALPDSSRQPSNSAHSID